MRHVLTINTYGKGGFAILGDVKVKKGAICSLKRNKDNFHGNCQLHARNIKMAAVSCLQSTNLAPVTLLNCRSYLCADFGATIRQRK